ncbi:MAG: glucokinase [Nitratireductor sp.]|nr:glucokinase [Nitratireductor sp.]
MKSRFPVLVGDIGGTNARFAVVGDAGAPAQAIPPVRIDQFETIEDAIDGAVLRTGMARPRSMMLAIATPLVGERFRLTNAPWVIDPAQLIERFSLGEVTLMNDFAAQGLAALALGEGDLVSVGGGAAIEGHPKVVVGPGTGLGIAQIFNVGGKWAVIPGEGGHVDLGPRTEREMAIWPFLKKEEGRMSAENALSGRGLENLYQAICRLEGSGMTARGASDISRLWLEGGDAPAREAVELFLSLLARVAGDMALLSLAHGGVYLAGGIAAKMLPGILKPGFRAEFDNKAPHTAIMKAIPLHVMTHPTAALEGQVACVRQPERFSLEGATLRFCA